MQPFVYQLPQEKIAQRPVHPPESARMLSWSGECGVNDSSFAHLPEQLSAGDVLVFNNTKVIPARLLGTLDGKQAEVLLLEQLSDDYTRWSCLGRPMKHLKPGAVVTFATGLQAHVEEVRGPRDVVIRLKASGEEDVAEALYQTGIMPIPPYIRKGRSDEQDLDDYQTIFAEKPGSVAAPTASLHFSEDLMQKIRDAGVIVEFVTLHVGAASFLPLQKDGDTVMAPGKERFSCPPETLERLRGYRAQGRRITAVGTTSVRALETIAKGEALSGQTELFIQPGYQFKMVDRLITNFHQPGTTHLLLVEALIGTEALGNIYQHALQHDYRFLSYGDGMFLAP